MTLKEKLQKYALIQKESLELLAKNEKDAAIAKMEEGAEVFADVVADAEALENATVEPKEGEAGFTPEEVTKLKKYASLYADASSIADLLKDIADAKDMITTLTKSIADQKEEIEKLKQVSGESQQSQEDITKSGKSKRPSFSGK